MRRTAIHWKTVIDDTTLEGDKSLMRAPEAFVRKNKATS